MNILIVRVGGSIGGAEIYNLNLIKGFKKYFPEVKLFFITNLPAFAKRLESSGAKVFVLSAFSEEVGTKKDLLKLFWHLPKYLFSYLKTVLFINRKKHLDLIWFHGTTEKIVLTPILKALGFSVVWLEQGPFFALPKTRIVIFLYKFSSRFVEKIITVSKDSRENIISESISQKKVICVQTSIDASYFSPLSTQETDKIKSELKIKKGEKIIGYVGTICQEKGIRDFLQVADLLSQKKIKFVLVGDGSMLAWIKRAAQKRNLARKFVFTGSQEEVKRYLGIFDIFFFPTYLEGLSLALLEAIAMGKPVVARNVGGNKELIVDGKTGYLFKNESHKEIANLLIKLLENKEKREKMGLAARKRAVEYFNLKRLTTDLHSVFTDCIKDET